MPPKPPPKPPPDLVKHMGLRTVAAVTTYEQRLEKEDKAMLRAIDWKTNGFAHGSEEISPLNHWRRTYSTPNFVQPFGGSVVEKHAAGLSLPKLAAGAKKEGFGGRRLEVRPMSYRGRARRAKSLLESTLRDEMVKTVGPLREQLRAEQAARRELEAELERICGGGAEVASLENLVD
mmetsp:Transcript_61736/g.174399  ORF Transcript_61736/g.174399 Transcript_61736/m.174399 type:complete len:177 (+) Transcript_61736:1-531(+)